MKHDYLKWTFDIITKCTFNTIMMERYTFAYGASLQWKLWIIKFFLYFFYKDNLIKIWKRFDESYWMSFQKFVVNQNDLARQTFLFGINQGIRGNLSFCFQTNFTSRPNGSKEFWTFSGTRGFKKLTPKLAQEILWPFRSNFTTSFYMVLWGAIDSHCARRKIRKPTYDRCLPTIRAWLS